jgi:hypothetical protein
MKTFIKATLFCAVIAACAGARAGDATVPVHLNGRRIKLDPAPIIRDGRTYVGLRGVAMALGGRAKWDNKSRTAIVTVGNKRTRVKQSQGITINDVLFLPLRTTGEAVGCIVKWDRANKSIRITSEAPCPKGGG